MNCIHLVAVFAQNRPGETARITGILAEAGLNIHWVTISSSGTYGVMKFLVDNCKRAVRSLKAHGLMVSLTEVLAVEVKNKPGALQGVADFLADKGLNLDNCSGFVANHRAILLIELHEITKARKLLQQARFKLLRPQQMLSL